MELKREKRIRQLADLLWKQPRTKWENILREPAGGDQELMAEAMDDARYCEDGDYPEGTDPNEFINALEKPEMIGPYRIVDTLGSGGMGVVYKGQTSGDGWARPVAIKVIKQSGFAERLLTRFRAEKEALARCTHTAIVQILDDGTTEDGWPYFVMEYVDAALPITAFCEKNSLTVEERLELMDRVCAAVQHAHDKGVVHCDLKPGNILITSDGHVKIVDFGISKIAKEEYEHRTLETLTSPFVRMGTVDYCSPEQLNGQPVTIKSDIYSLGVLAYELLASQKPYNFSHCPPFEIVRKKFEEALPSPSAESAVMGGLPSATRYDLDRAILRALAPNPDNRHKTVEMFSAALSRAIEGSRAPFKQIKAIGYHVRSPLARAALATTVVGLLLFIGLLVGVRLHRPVNEPVSKQLQAEDQPIRRSGAGDAEPPAAPPKDEFPGARERALWIVFGTNLSRAAVVADPEVIDAAPFVLCENSSKIDLSIEPRAVVTELCNESKASEAFTKVKELARQRRRGASTILAYALYFGSQYIAKNPWESLKWANASAAAGDVAAMRLMGLHKLEGLSGPVDYKQAVRWLERAANQNDILSQAKLCYLPEIVKNVALRNDRVRAYVWCNIAASNPSAAGSDRADLLRSRVRRMRDEQVKHLSQSELTDSEIILRSKGTSGQ